MDKAHSIGVFDSGVGGLTVAQEVMRRLPLESIAYFGDTARVPYGGKNKETIIRYSIEGAIFLSEQKIKLLVIACHTASAFTREKLKQLFRIPVVDVIEPCIERAIQTTRNGHIAVLGTRATMQSGVYQQEIKKLMPEAQITAIACPLFVPLVEEHFLSHEASLAIVREYLAPLRQLKVDTVVLGCTHYPLLRPLIERVLDGSGVIVDPAVTCAEKIATLLTEAQLQATQKEQSFHRYFVSDDPEKFRALGAHFLGVPLEHVEHAFLERV